MDNFIKSKQLFNKLRNIIINYNILKYLIKLCDNKINEIYYKHYELMEDLNIISLNINRFEKYYDINEIINLINIIDKTFYEFNTENQLKELINKLNEIKLILENKINKLKMKLKCIIKFKFNNDEDYNEKDNIKENKELYETFKYYLLNEEFNNFISSIKYYIDGLENGIELNTIFNFNDIKNELDNI